MQIGATGATSDGVDVSPGLRDNAQPDIEPAAISSSGSCQYVHQIGTPPGARRNHGAKGGVVSAIDDPTGGRGERDRDRAVGVAEKAAPAVADERLEDPHDLHPRVPPVRGAQRPLPRLAALVDACPEPGAGQNAVRDTRPGDTRDIRTSSTRTVPPPRGTLTARTVRSSRRPSRRDVNGTVTWCHLVSVRRVVRQAVGAST